jgi:myxalamid-type polyketide synthase MxaE and MxaD
LPDQGSAWDLVHLGAIDLPVSPASAAALEEALLEQGAMLARLIALVTSRGGRLWLATRGAQPVGGGAGSAPQAALWGLLRVLEVEHPDHLGAMIDLPAEVDPEEAAALLLGEIHGPDGEREIALRSGDRLALRLQKATLGARGRGRPAPKGITLITGGLGDLGMATAARLVERGARRLALIGRRGVHPGAEPAVEALRATGAEVITAAVDVGDERALRAFLGGLPGKVAAVFHAAGVHRPSALVELSPEALREDLRAKVVGGWLLDRLVNDADPFVLFSSAATLLGSPRLGAYTMANAYLDALAHERRARGLPALAIDWGFWSDIGMAARGAREQGRSLVPRGMEALSPEDALDLLDLLLGSAPPAQIGALALNVQAFAGAYPSAGAAPRLASLVAAAPAEGSSPPPLTAARRALLEGDEGPLTAYLAAATARVLRVTERGLSLDQPLLRLGLDSLMAVELRNRIETDLQVSLPLVSVLACRGVRPLAAEVTQRARMDVEEVTI